MSRLLSATLSGRQVIQMAKDAKGGKGGKEVEGTMKDALPNALRPKGRSKGGGKKR